MPVAIGQFGVVASKCDLCGDRETPACVEHCPNEAIKLKK